VKKGLTFLAMKTGSPIVPLAADVKNKKILKSWDRFLLPLPFFFNRMKVLSGKPVYIKKDENIDEAGNKIRRALNDISVRAGNLL
ncbi:MAG: hypothetical protein PF545_07610, partial [Elusimicrobia bacterium]|nr:hypothetical protein [Elusimicrobiota bacterium]